MSVLRDIIAVLTARARGLTMMSLQRFEPVEIRPRAARPPGARMVIDLNAAFYGICSGAGVTISPMVLTEVSARQSSGAIPPEVRVAMNGASLSRIPSQAGWRDVVQHALPDRVAGRRRSLEDVPRGVPMCWL